MELDIDDIIEKIKLCKQLKKDISENTKTNMLPLMSNGLVSNEIDSVNINSPKTDVPYKS